VVRSVILTFPPGSPLLCPFLLSVVSQTACTSTFSKEHDIKPKRSEKEHLLHCFATCMSGGVNLTPTSPLPGKRGGGEGSIAD